MAFSSKYFNYYLLFNSVSYSCAFPTLTYEKRALCGMDYHAFLLMFTIKLFSGERVMGDAEIVVFFEKSSALYAYFFIYR